MTCHRYRSIAAIALVGLCLLLPNPAPARGQFAPVLGPAAGDTSRPAPARTWRLTFDDSADSDGTISFRIWPGDASPLHVDVPVLTGQSENQIAANASDVLRTRLGERYRVEVDDGEHVLVKARRGTPAFTVELLRDTALDVEVAVKAE